MEITGDKLRGHLELLILATLDRGEAHGLEILKRLETRGCGLLQLKEGSLYPALYRLEANKEVQASWEKSAHGRRGARRRIYRLTPKGTRRLHHERSDWHSFVATLNAIISGADAPVGYSV
ncbi:MAG: helix-turn-helix transcriptional regulator [Phycisphaerae bacterium]